MSAIQNQPVSRDHAKIMSRADLCRRLIARLKHEEAVIGGIGFSNFDLFGAGHRAQNFYMLGSMGLAAPIALGVALAQKQRRVFALEGDGSLLMQLGALGTIAMQRPANLCLIILDNGAYQITGGQTAASGAGTDLIAIARASGLAQSAWAADEAAFGEMVERALAEDGPWVIGCRIDHARPEKQTPRDPSRIRDEFMRGLGVKK